MLILEEAVWVVIMVRFILLMRMRSQSGDEDFFECIERMRTQAVGEHSGIRWIESYAMLGRYDAIEVFDAPNHEAAIKVAAMARDCDLSVEVLQAVAWGRAKQLAGGGVRSDQNQPGRHEFGGQSERGSVAARPVRDAVQEASEESFPASDPPAWTGTTVG